MDSDVPAKRKKQIDAWRALYVTCCITGPVCVILSFVAFLLWIWQSNGKWGATGWLLLGMAGSAWVVGAIAYFLFGQGKELDRLKRQAGDRDYR